MSVEKAQTDLSAAAALRSTVFAHDTRIAAAIRRCATVILELAPGEHRDRAMLRLREAQAEALLADVRFSSQDLEPTLPFVSVVSVGHDATPTQ